MTLSLTEFSKFSKIPLNKNSLTENYEASHKFLQHDRRMFTEGAHSCSKLSKRAAKNISQC